jgi:S-adenosylmethionine uptake transporter
MNDNQRGALIMMLSMFAFLINDIFMKLASPDLPLAQAIFIRGLLTSAILFTLSCLKFKNIFRDFKGNYYLITLRTIGEIGGTWCFLSALFKMPIANLMMILQATPIAITLFSYLIFKEILKRQVIIALLFGFIGVLIILRPGFEGFDKYSLLGLGAVFFVVLRDLATRKMIGNIRTVDIAFLAAFSITIISGVLTYSVDWVPIDAKTFFLLIAATAALVVAYQLAVAVMRIGQVSFVSQFRYSAILWAILFGYLFFGEFPDFYTLSGGLVVILAGLTILWKNKSEKNIVKGVDKNY